jgi:hypothetical protein
MSNVGKTIYRPLGNGNHITEPQKNIRATYSCAGKNSRVARKKRRHGLVSPWLAKHQRAKKRAGNWLQCLTIVNSAYKPTNITGGPHIV